MRFLAGLASLLLVVAVLLPDGASAQRGPERARSRAAASGVPMHFEDRDLTEVIEAVARATGLRFVFGNEVRGRVTITVPGRVDTDAAVELLYAALYLRGFTALPLDDETIRIVPVAETSSGAPLADEARSDVGEHPITTMIDLRSADAGAVVEALAPYVSRNGVALAYPPTNSIVLAGTEGQLVRLVEITRAIDRAESEGLLVRALRYRPADLVAQMIETVYNVSPVESEHVSTWVDERTNRVIVQGHPAKLEDVRRFVEGVDRPVEGEGLVRVVRIRNRDAEEMGELLNALAEEGRRASRARADRRPESIPEIADVLVGRSYHVEVDVPTQSLLITADPETFAVLAGVIAELDRLPPRVSVEVMVFEITRPRGSRFGVNYFLPLTNPTGFDDLLVTTNSVGGGRVSEPSGDSVTFGRYVRRPLIPIVGPDGTVTVIPLEASDVSFEAGARIAETSILLRPNIIGVSGEEHEVFAGNNVPIPVASTPAAPTEGEVAIQDPLALSQNVERADIGTRLRLRPVVGQRGVVQLELELEVSDLVDSAVGSVEEVGPTFADRNLQAKISLAPGQRAMVGSLGAQVTTYSRTGIPFLMSIPGLGWLFSTVERRYDETDLVAVVEARVIHGSDEAAAESIRRRLAFERSVSRVADLTGVGEDPFAVLLETARSETDARVIADAFAADGFETRITPWDAWGQPVWDVYLTGMRSFEEAGRLARRLADAGWTPEITVLSPVNELAGD